MRRALGRVRAGRLAAAAVAFVAACAAAAPAPASAAAINSFSGSCTGYDVTVWWDPPLTADIRTVHMHGEAGGGTCGGTLNGKRVADEPIGISLDESGAQSCEVADGAGVGTISIAGKRIGVGVHYQRLEREAALVFEGAGGGQALLKVHARIGLVPPDSPLAPFAGPLVDTNYFADVIAQCRKDGLKSIQIYGEQLITTSPLWSEAPRSGASSPTTGTGQRAGKRTRSRHNTRHHRNRRAATL